MSQSPLNISVIIVEDHSIFVEGLNSIFERVEGLTVKGTFADGESALAFLKKEEVDVVFLDISLPEMSGLEVCKVIKAMNRNIKVIALTNHTEKSVIQEMLQNGANGYLLKNSSRQDLVAAIQEVINNRFVMPQELQSVLFSPGSGGNIPRLTTREKEILLLVSNGHTTAAIAKQLFISPQTVETHRRNLMQKLEVNNSAAMIKKALEAGLLPDV